MSTPSSSGLKALPSVFLGSIKITLPTAQVIGPTHAAAYFGEVA
jgi:hypothetical protein